MPFLKTSSAIFWYLVLSVDIIDKPSAYNLVSSYCLIISLLTASLKYEAFLLNKLFFSLRSISLFVAISNSSRFIKSSLNKRFITQFLLFIAFIGFLYGLYVLGAFGKAASIAISSRFSSFNDLLK